VQLSHDPLKTHASFDDPNLVSRAGLVPVMALAGRCGLAGLAGEHVRIASRAGVNAHLKIDLPRAFRTADLWLIHAADCCSRYSSWTCCGVRY
jgi:hypothetical protein